MLSGKRYQKRATAFFLLSVTKKHRRPKRAKTRNQPRVKISKDKKANQDKKDKGDREIDQNVCRCEFGQHLKEVQTALI